MRAEIAILSSLSIIGLAFLAGGCARNEEPESKPSGESSGVVDAIADEVTGYRAVKQGQQVKEQLREIEAQRNEQMEGILSDTAPAER